MRRPLRHPSYARPPRGTSEDREWWEEPIRQAYRNARDWLRIAREWLIRLDALIRATKRPRKGALRVHFEAIHHALTTAARERDQARFWRRARDQRISEGRW